ncbi:OmpA family protein [Anaeromyxobacter terrae]|uniref:OmpA family protein n=1 Tax=Anaeromyxobacter terrae TaxID=2925406 RepID=UPI001F5812B1|nr:OmpA family protein [Anaeromyxobacter sp. SG22]
MNVRRLGALLAVALAGDAAAQAATTFELERLQLDPAARGSLVVGNGEVAPAGTLRAVLGAERQHRSLVRLGDDLLGRRSGDHTAALVEDRDTLRLVLDYVVVPRVELYGRANFIMSQGQGLQAASSGWGVPSVGLRLGALQQSSGAPFNLAVAGEFLPSWGTRSLFARPENPAGFFRLELGRDMGNHTLGIEGGYYLTDKQVVGIRTVGKEIRYGVALARKGILRPEISYRGAVGVDGDTGPAYGEVLAGLRVNVGVVEVFGLGGPGLFNRYGTPQWRALVGAALRFEPKERKVEEPAPAPAPPPPPPPDPCAPGQAHTPDQCPDLDDDGDGVLNKDDACPTEKGLPELNGCPAKDSDGDGVPDHLDKCPTEPGPAENQGCPRVVVEKEAKKVELREKVQFDTGKATIKPESNGLLDEIAKVLTEHAEISRVVIEGHSDSTGGAALNKRLSQARADSVVTALVERGVAKERLSAKGFGPSRPIASNDTPEGREANRRVEISIAQTE